MVHLRQRGAPSGRTQVNDADEGGCGAHHPPQPTRTTWSWPTPTCPTESPPRFVRPVPSSTRRGLDYVRPVGQNTRSCLMSARGIVGARTPCLPRFPGTHNARSLLGGPVRTVAHTRGSAAAVDRRHWSRRLRPTRLPWSSRTVGAVDRTRDRVFDELVGGWQSVHRRYGQRRFSSPG